jgi:hypothetical protein
VTVFADYPSLNPDSESESSNLEVSLGSMRVTLESSIFSIGGSWSSSLISSIFLPSSSWLASRMLLLILMEVELRVGANVHFDLS